MDVTQVLEQETNGRVLLRHDFPELATVLDRLPEPAGRAERWGPRWFAELRQLIAKAPELDLVIQKELRRRAARDPIAFAVLYFSDRFEHPETGEIAFSERDYAWAQIALLLSERS
jgi:hypothetical protein